MPRQLRIQYEGAIYHLMSRGDRREEIFRDAQQPFHPLHQIWSRCLTMRFNRRHKLSGHLFAGRYKSLLVDGATSGYLRTVCDYVHLNPVRAKLLGKGERLQKYRWSSYPSYLRGRQKREPWLRCDRLFGEHGLMKDSGRSRLEF